MFLWVLVGLSRRASLELAAVSIVPEEGRVRQRARAAVSTVAEEHRVRQRVREAIAAEPGLAGKLVRLAFHDSVRGRPNGSVRYELQDPENVGLAVPLAVVEELCGHLSTADAIALAAAEALAAAGGPIVPVRLGRRDASEADARFLRHPIGSGNERDVVRTALPSPGLSTVGIRRFFGRRLGFSDEETVALMGAHTLGRHVSLLGMSKPCLRNLTRACLEAAPVRLPFVATAPDTFDNSYFVQLLRWEDGTIERGAAAFIPTDVALVLDDRYHKYVEIFARDETRFARVFARAFSKLLNAGF
ncbi:hypothetical protein CTAYLR_002789 [Chrysophaeum taylorii]|uniref:Plant heme peroxidase family profile domain-containing protein n=1 Tax=Chrysophaeum taylorii TaxID=2483200 RepID=A0AAD7UE35_9STRA|nr:hypothetical protein CTAYLR_002789 [Chrysophaeum taylorii]